MEEERSEERGMPGGRRERGREARVREREIQPRDSRRGKQFTPFDALRSLRARRSLGTRRI
jgi:hypothetical protein